MVKHGQQNMSQLRLTDYVIDALALSILGDAFLKSMFMDDSLTPVEALAGNKWLLAANALVYLFFFLRLVFCTAARQRLLQLVRADGLFWLPIALLLGGVFVSAIWSFEPGITLRRAVALSGTVMIGAYLGARYSPREFLRLIFGMIAVLAVLSVLMVIFWPEKGLMQAAALYWDQHAGRWRGVFLHKNQCGTIMSLGIIVAAGLLAGNKKRMAGVLAVLALFVGVLAAAESMTALVALVFGLLVMLFMRVLPLRATSFLGAGIGLIPLLVLSAGLYLYQVDFSAPPAEQNSVHIQGTAPAPSSTVAVQPPRAVVVQPPGQNTGFTRDSTATGRLEIWELSWQEINKRPLLGYGFATFWRNGGPAEAVWRQTEFHAPNAHNGWIDLALDLGIPAVIILAAWMLWLALRLLRWAWAAANKSYGFEAIVLLGLFSFVNMNNMAESVVFRHNELTWSLLIAIAVLTSFAANGSKVRH